MKNTRLTLTLIISVIFCGACAKQNKVQTVHDASAANGNNEVLKADNSLNNSLQVTAVAPARVDPQQSEKGKTTVRNGSDHSNIATMIDGFGNKVESRVFGNNPRLVSVTLRTNVKGEVTADVMGRNGRRMPVPPEMLDRTMMATADELADKLGIIAPQVTVRAQQPIPTEQKLPSAPPPPVTSETATSTVTPVQQAPVTAAPSALQSNQADLQSLPHR